VTRTTARRDESDSTHHARIEPIHVLLEIRVLEVGSGRLVNQRDVVLGDVRLRVIGEAMVP
jgi:hypothetical protein